MQVNGFYYQDSERRWNPVNGYVSEFFGIDDMALRYPDKDYRTRWIVTHLESGMQLPPGLGDFDTKEEAITVVVALEASDIKWTGRNAAEISKRNREHDEAMVVRIWTVVMDALKTVE